MAVNRPWLCACLIWSVLGGSALYFTDRSFAGPVIWVATALFLGFIGPFFLERLIEIIPHHGRGWPADPFFIAPVLGLIPGTLLGPLLGLWVAWAGGEPAGEGALLGAVFAPSILAIMLLISVTVWPTEKPVLPETAKRHEPDLTRHDRFLIVLLCLALPVVVVMVLVRCVVWVPRRRQRLRVYARLQELNGVFGADPAGNKFYGVRLEGPAIQDADVALLRVFPELDHVTLSGTQVTDAGLAHLAGLVELVILDLSGTRIGDAGLDHLQCLGNLMLLNLRGTQVTQAGVERLLMKRPGLQVKR